MPRLHRKSFDEGDDLAWKIAVGAGCFISLVWFAILIGIGYVAIHFIAKYW